SCPLHSNIRSLKVKISILSNSFFKYSRISSANLTWSSSEGRTNAKIPFFDNNVFDLTKKVAQIFLTEASVRPSFICIFLLSSICFDESIFFLTYGGFPITTENCLVVEYSKKSVFRNFADFLLHFSEAIF